MDKSIFELMKELKKRNRRDLADLVLGSKSEIEETTQYGSYWNKYQSVFYICAPSDQYRRLQELPKNDRDVILECVKGIFPKSEDLEIGFLDFRIRGNEEGLKKNKLLAESWLERSKNKFSEGGGLLRKSAYAEAISSFQECIELSLKASFLFLTDSYPKSHEFKEKEFQEILDKIPNDLVYLQFHKLYLYSRFWSNFYTIAKYGLENFGIGAEKLFEKEEAALAKKHAERCYSAADLLKNYLEHPW
jgi:HEPN domain-containing protein